MKKKLFLMFGLGAMLLTSCDQDIVNEIYLPGGGGSVVVTDSTSSKELQVFTNLETMRPAVSTRAVDNQWEANDMIGISSTGMMDNMKFTRSGSTSQFIGASTVWFTDTDIHTFNAYYPYTATPASDLIEFDVPEDAVQSEQKINDFLFASGTASYANPNLTLNFTHQMVRLIIKVYTAPEYGFTTNSFSGYNLTLLNHYCNGTFNIKTGEVKCGDKTYSPYYLGEAKNDHLEFVLYLPAQNTTDMVLEINTGETFRFNASGSTWQSGHSYSYSLKPVRNTLQVMSTSITHGQLSRNRLSMVTNKAQKEDWRVS